MNQATHLLCLWLEKRLIADIEYVPAEEKWSLRYADDWLADRNAFPLSPALPMERDISARRGRRH
jgi:serine/threonine-protein kinase HipA